MAIAYGSMKLDVCQKGRPINNKELLAIVHCLKTWRYFLGSHKAKVYTDNVSLKYFEIQMQVSHKSWGWHNSLALMKVDFIHKLDHGNVVLDALSRQEVF